MGRTTVVVAHHQRKNSDREKSLNKEKHDESHSSDFSSLIRSSAGRNGGFSATDQPYHYINGNGAWMGVSVADVTSANMSTLKLKENAAWNVLVVTPESGIEGGNQERDVILDFNGSRIEGVDQFSA